MIRGFLDGEVRASWLARYYWCSEESYIKAVLKVFGKGPEPTYATEGRKIHEKKEDEKLPERTEILKSIVREVMGFDRILDGKRIFVHPDRFRVTKGSEVIIVEDKTTTGNKVDFYSLAPALCQIRVYIYVLNRELLPLGYRLYNLHRVMFYKRGTKRSGQLVHVEWIPWDGIEEPIEEEIREIFKFWKGEKKPIPPAMWKCRNCPSYIKWKCRIFQEFRWGDPDYERRFSNERRRT